MTKKIKTQNNNTKMVVPPRFVFTEYQALNRYRRLENNNEFLDILAEELTHWAENDDDALSMQQFYVKKRMLQEEFRRLTEKSENLKKAYAHALNCIGARRMSGAFKKKYDSALVTRYQAMFDPEVKRHEEWAAKIKQQDDNKPERHVVVVPDIDVLRDKK